MRLPSAAVSFLKTRLMSLSAVDPDEIIGPGIRSRKRDGHVRRGWLRQRRLLTGRTTERCLMM